MKNSVPTTNATLIGALGLALLGTTCCALPALLVALGFGGAVVSMVSTFPWLKPLSQCKEITFLLTGLALGFCFWRLQGVRSCELNHQPSVTWQKPILWFSTTIFVASLFVAYALLPLTKWWEL